MSTTLRPTTQLTAPKLRKRPRLSVSEPYEEQGARFVQGCQAAREQSNAEFPSREELQGMEEQTGSRKQSMEEAQDHVSRAKRILYALQGNCKHWDFGREDVAAGKVHIVPDSYSNEQVNKAIHFLEEATVTVQNALGSVLMDEEKQCSLCWVEEALQGMQNVFCPQDMVLCLLHALVPAYSLCLHALQHCSGREFWIGLLSCCLTALHKACPLLLVRL